METINSNTKSFVENLAKKYEVVVEWDPSVNSTFQEQVNLIGRKISI